MFAAFITLAIIAVGALIVGLVGSERQLSNNQQQEMRLRKRFSRFVSLGAAALSLLCLIFACIVTVPVGHVSVATLFGEIAGEPFPEGIHFTNPLYRFTQFDVRQKSHKETAGVPSKDQLITKLDVSVQYRINRGMAHKILEDTGTHKEVLEVHMIPKLRSLLREQGKTVERTEDFFKQEVQERLQNTLLASMKTFLQPKGVDVDDVLIRSIIPPAVILTGIEKKKLRDQLADEQVAELRRFETEQEQKVKQATAERKASEEESQRIKILADAKAYEIQKINEAIASNPAYIQLQALKSLEAISKDTSSKIYFLNGDSPQPLPLMHMGLQSMGRGAQAGSGERTAGGE